MLLRKLLAVVAVAAGVFAGSAGAITLAEVDGGALSFLSGDETLLFDNFQVVTSGDVSSDLTDYDIEILENGFRIVALDSALSLSGGEFGDVVVSYDVWAQNDLLIDGAVLDFVAAAAGAGALASVSEDLSTGGGGSFADLAVIVTGGGTAIPSDSVDFAPIAHIQVIKDIVANGDGGTSASIESVDQTFSVVPEPGTLLLIGPGIAGLALAGRRRA